MQLYDRITYEIKRDIEMNQQIFGVYNTASLNWTCEDIFIFICFLFCQTLIILFIPNVRLGK